MSFSDGSHLIAAFMEMNKPTSWPKGFDAASTLPSDGSSKRQATNFDRREFSLLQTWLLANLGHVSSLA
ncbi:hypothetical protein TNCV_1299681 [Trichonephila clavipes]|nr:hypothetical protein TNCV_1299681 [Trichonephila clavipes]